MKTVYEQCHEFLSDLRGELNSPDRLSSSMLEEFIDGIDYPPAPEDHPHYEVQIVGPDGLLLSLMIDGAWSTSIYSGAPLPVGNQLVIRRVK